MENYKNSNSFPKTRNAYGTLQVNDNIDYSLKNIPMGLSFAFTQNAAAMTAFENMDPEKKKLVIDRASKVSSKKEMIQLVQNIATNNL